MNVSIRNAVRRDFYLDSVALMRLSREIAALGGVEDAALMIATAANLELLAAANLLAAEPPAAGPNDLIIAVRADGPEAAEAALATATALLKTETGKLAASFGKAALSLRGALSQQPGATLALISVPGEYAAGLARKALASGLDVMIFSDNVPLGEEVALKRHAQALGRLVMGPDCGTAIIAGAPLGFANRVPGGAIGLIGASGTGLQEVSCLLAQAGTGISQAIGVGSRDLSREVGGLATLAAIDLLDDDPTTEHIVLISKPPHPQVITTLLDRVGRSRKPFTLCFLGAKPRELPGNASAVETLSAAARQVLAKPLAAAPVSAKLSARAGTILGLFSGGTLCAEAQLILLAAGRRVASNAGVPGAANLVEAAMGSDRLIDLGADEFTRGRPHPMIDPAARAEALRSGLADASLAVILLDVVLGFGAHPDPAGAIAACLTAAAPQRPHVIASVTGTEADPQVRSRQAATLSAAGVLLAPSNADAAELAARLAKP
jgi:FdrA protein